MNCLGIVYNPETKKILIGRRENDPHIKELSWSFPGGRPGYDRDLEDYLREEIRKKTGIEVRDGRVVFAKTYPEKREFLSIYYFIVSASSEASTGEGFSEVKWVKPTEVRDYFTTSMHPKLIEFLEGLERGEHDG